MNLCSCSTQSTTSRMPSSPNIDSALTRSRSPRCVIRASSNTGKTAPCSRSLFPKQSKVHGGQGLLHCLRLYTLSCRAARARPVATVSCNNQKALNLLLSLCFSVADTSILEIRSIYSSGHLNLEETQLRIPSLSGSVRAIGVNFKSFKRQTANDRLYLAYHDVLVGL
jgi:hypothetical protein